MNRKVPQEQNDISLIIGNLPKRLQNKIAANCGSAAEDAENEIPAATQLAILCGKNGERVNLDGKVPVLETSGSENRSSPSTTAIIKPAKTIATSEVVIPGILRVQGPIQAKNNGKQNQNKKHQNRKMNKALNSRGQELAVRELHLPASPVRVRLTTDHPVWFEQLIDIPELKDIIQLYDQLIALQQRELLLNKWDIFCETHDKLQRRFKKLLLEHLKLSYEQKIDNFFWKLLLYNIREYLKSLKSKDAYRRILALIDQSQQFYTALFEDFQAKHLTHDSNHKYEIMARVLAQRLLICLGDLSRYRACQMQTPDYVDTYKYYKQAQLLIPTNGAPYNQLAIVAVHARKRYDAVYYYMRSLLSSNPIQTAKESLLDLFDDIRKKYEETELKLSPVHNSPGQTKKQKSMRKEVWIYPDGKRRLHRTDMKTTNKNQVSIAEENRFAKLTPDELLRRLFTLHLYLLGKLYTGIGMETIYQQLRKLHIHLNVVLQHKNLLNVSKALKIVALNIFVVEQNMINDSRREIRYHAFTFCNAIFGLMLQKANQILNSVIGSDGNATCSTEDFIDLNMTLQYIKIYVHWLDLNRDIWEPIRSEEHCFIDSWQELQKLFNNIENFLDKTNEFSDTKLQNIVLDEDTFLNGFAPLGYNCPSELMRVSSSPESLQFLKRIKNISEFQSCYEQFKHRLQLPLNSSFGFEDLDNEMQVAFKDFVTDGQSNSANHLLLTENISTNTNVSDNVEKNIIEDGATEVTQLCKLKKELEAKNKAKEMYNAKLQEILKFVDTKLYIEVRPRYLLPDTNCFIDCLEDFEKLSQQFKHYTLIIPLTVVKELDGLSKGVKIDMHKNGIGKQRIHHFDEVSSRAKKTLEFIKKANNYVKCATTKGSIINASLFALVEEEYVSNDDKILATAVALSKSMSTETSRDGKCLIQTELVLITTDRNLRVKALSRNLAVSALDEFLQWAKHSNGT